MRSAALQLDLDSYAGPFDLLCTLLLRREIGVEDVALAEIVVGYVQQLSEQQRVDPDTASEFLLLVAALMEIKARELLAQDTELEIEEPGSIDAQGDMLERLVRYSTFRTAAQWLSTGAGQQRWWRVASRPVRRKREGVYEGPVMDPALLHRSMTVLLAQRDVDIRHLVGRHASVSEMTGRLLTALRQRTKFTLDEAVAFVAALELCKNGHVELRQDARFGPIEVTRREATGDADGEAADGVAGETEFQTA
jgi:segregation and condensation protein A